MNIDLLSISALVVVAVLFVVIFYLRSKKLIGFTTSVLGAMVIGAALGFGYSGHTTWVAPIGTIYVCILSAIVGPLIVVSILSSVTSLGSIVKLRKIGLRSVLWLSVTTVLAILLALALGLITGVGSGANLVIEGVNAESFANKVTSFSKVLIDFFPENIISDFAEGKIIPMILFTILIAVSYILVANKHKEKVFVFKQFVDALKEIIFKAVGFVIELTPYAVLALVTNSIGNKSQGTDIMWSLGFLLLLTFIACIIEIWLLGGVLVKSFADLKPIRFFRKIIPAQIVAFSTQASVGTLPVTTRLLTEEIGVGTEVANFTAPLGTTIGMPGCSGIWPVLCAIYAVNGLGIPYGFQDYLVLGVVSLFISFGTAGVPGTATVTTASVFTAIGLPLEVLILVVPIAAIADTARTATNVSAAMIASAIVARQTGDLDDDIFNGLKQYEAEETAPVTYRKKTTSAAAGSGQLAAASSGYAEDEGAPLVGACSIGEEDEAAPLIGACSIAEVDEAAPLVGACSIE
jgi:Na+/H+-dicarboxylate symporter